MPSPLPARPSLDWLRKRAKRTLKQLRQARPGARLAEAQLALAREHGFTSWRALHAAVVDGAAGPVAPPAISEEDVAGFLRQVGSGDPDAVEALLLERPGLVNAAGPHPFWGGRPQPLHLAIETNRPEMVKLLLRHGADVNGRHADYLWWSPLLLTYHWGRPGVRAMLLRRGARVGLAEALVSGDDRRALRMLRAGPSALSEPAPNGGSWLMFARTTRAIDRLLALGVPVDQRDRWGATPMEAFSRLGPRGKPLVRHLVTRGVAAGPEAFARLNDRRTLTRLVREDPALIRNPALLKAAVDFGHWPLATWLMDLGADPNGRGGGQADETPLHSAAWNGDAAMVELLLSRGADPTLRDRQHDGTPSGWAETAVEVTNNPACAPLAERLVRAAEEWERRQRQAGG